MYFKCGINQSGFLSVSVYNKETKEPVPFASVSVLLLTIRGLYGESGEANLIARHITDENGEIPKITLPVINRNVLPYSQYYMVVNHFRYYTVNLMNVKIYPNVTTDYNVMLTPLTSKHPDYEFLITPELK